MKALSMLAAASLAAAVSAQGITFQTLTMNPQGAGYTYSNDGNNFFDMIVSNPAGITLHGLTVRTISPVGTTGTIELWMMDPAIATSHIGREVVNPAPTPAGHPSGWSLLSSGPYVSGGPGSSSGTCQSAYVTVPDTFLAPGTYGFAIDHVGIWHIWDAVLAYPQPAGSFANLDLELTNGNTQAVSWTSATLGAFTAGGNSFAGCIPEISVHYSVGQVPHACAAKSQFGEGSVKNSASFWQQFQSPAAASTALTGRSLQMIFTGTGYAVSQGTATYVPPTPAAVALPANDNLETPITPTIPVLYPSAGGGSIATDLHVHSNGYISVGTQTVLNQGPIDPQAGNLAAQETAWYCHHDFDSSEAGSGQVVWEEDLVNGVLYVTWQGVESKPATAANPSTVQFQFNQVTGDVTIVFQQIDATGGSGIFGSDWWLIGFSPGGPSPQTPAFDFATLAPFVTFEPEAFGLALAPTGDALVGGTVDLVTSNEVGLSVGINLISDFRYPAAFPLSPLGAPSTTVTWLDPAQSIANLITNIPGAGSMNLTIPISNIPTLAGIEIHSQSFWLDLGATGLFDNMLCSNGVSFVVGNVVVP